MGAKNAARVLYLGEWWRLFTTLALHGGVVHFAVNAVVQLRIGLWLEVLWGHSVWILIYATSGTFSSLVSCVLLPDILSVGASGAICGVIGAGLVYIVMTWHQTLPQDIRERNYHAGTLAANIVMTSILSLAPMADFAAHLGGFVSGAVLAVGLFADKMQERSANFRSAAKVLSGIAFGCLFFLTQMQFYNYGQPTRGLLNICEPSECQ